MSGNVFFPYEKQSQIKTVSRREGEEQKRKESEKNE